MEINIGTKMSEDDDVGLSAKMVNELKSIKDGVVSRIGLGLLKTILRGVKITADKLWETERP